MKPLYVVGDIHGMFQPFLNIMKQITDDVKEPSVLCFLGDYVDRGPASYEVIEFLRLFEHPMLKVVCLKGNHEDMMMEALANPLDDLWTINGGSATVESYVNNDQWPVPQSHREFLHGLKLFYVHDMERLGERYRIVCVHAGLDPEKQLDDHNESMLLWSRKFTDYKGEYAAADMVVYGHTPARNVYRTDHQIGIDTAAVFEGWLTCVKFPTDKEPVFFFAK